MAELQSRKFQLTIMNPQERGYTHERIKEIISEFDSVIYWCMSDEIAPEEQTPHTHIYIQFLNARRVTTILNKFPKIHYEICRGTAQQNKDYVFKEGKWLEDKKRGTRIDGTQEEYGEVPIERQGQRNDLTDLYDMIKSGMTDYEIITTNQNYMLQIEKIQMVRKIILGESYKRKWRDLTVTYIYGETGTGKSRHVIEKHGHENLYRVTDYNHPWDGYACQPVIVFEEFRSSLTCADMLNYLDGYPVDLPCRYSNKVACYETVYIISNISLEDQYLKVQRESPETYKAFMRRIHKVLEFSKQGIQEEIYLG